MGKQHTVQRGETIIQIASQNGFRSWEPIWTCDENAALREQRPNPHVLAKGDKLYVPDKKPIDYSCQTNLKHTFRVPSLTQHFQQTVLDPAGEPMTDIAYQLVTGGKTFKGKTDSSGTLQHEIPLHAKTGELTLWLQPGQSPSVWKVQIGHLEHIETIYGLKGRLYNLGYDCGAVDDAFDEKTKKALAEFQSDYGLDATGENNPQTRAKLEEIHDQSMR